MKNFEETNVEEMAYLLVDDKNIGVTDDIADIVAYLKDKETADKIVITKGYKNNLLSLQQRILLCDEAFSNIKDNNIAIPHKQVDCNLIKRCTVKRKLQEIVKYIDKAQEQI